VDSNPGLDNDDDDPDGEVEVEVKSFISFCGAGEGTDEGIGLAPDNGQVNDEPEGRPPAAAAAPTPLAVPVAEVECNPIKEVVERDPDCVGRCP